VSVDYIILGILSLAPRSGYDMKAEVEKGSVGMLSALSFGSIYPRLKSLEQAGLITVQEEEQAGRGKRMYELTAEGWRQLQNWLDLPSEYPIPQKDELLLKMLFWGAAGADRTTLIEHLKRRRDESSDFLRYLAERPQDGRSFIDEYGMLVLEYMQSRLEAEIGWIDKAIRQLEGEPAVPIQDPHWLSVLQKSRRTKALNPEADEEPEAKE
jgi:DNA-binding PadR family transcriptional regulator